MGLKIWLPLNGNTKQQGLSNITMIGSPSNWVNGKIGQCAHFAGNTANAIYNNTTDFNYTDNFSWAVWIKTNFTGTTAQYAFTNGRADAGGYGYGIQCVSSANCYVRFGNQSYAIPVTGGEWTHLVFTKKGTLITIYKNGSVHTSQTFNGTLPTYSDGNGLGLGCFHYSGDIYPFYGDLNDFRIYDHCLSPRECKQISTALVLHYPLAMPGQENLTPCGGIYTQSNPRTTTSSKTDGGVWIPNSAFEGTPSTTYTISVQCDGTLSSAHGSGGLSPADKPWSFWLYISNTDTSKSWQTGGYDKPVNLNSSNNNYRKIGNTHVWTYTLSSTQKYISLRTNSYSDGTTDITVNWWNIKIEKGDTFTPWVPNTSSELYAALGFDDGIEYDVSGFNHNGTKHGAITYDADTPRYNTSTYFNGSSDIRSAKSSFGWFDFKEGTVAAWFKPANTTQTWASVGVQNDGGTGSRSFSICNYSGKAAIVVGYDSSWGSYSSDYSMSANVWYHLCATITNGDTVKLYVNGELVQTRTVTNTTGTIASTTQFAVGVDLPGSDERFTGHLSDVRFYTTCLNESDVRELYNTSMSLSNNGVLFGYEFIE